MRVTKFMLTYNSVAIRLPIEGALPTDEFICKQIDGLGPPEAGVLIANTLKKGAQHQGRRPLARQIVAKIGLGPNYEIGQTASDLRQKLYTLLAPGDAGDAESDVVFLQIFDERDQVWGTARGYINRIEIVPFSNVPEVQLTMDCLSTYFDGPVVNVDVAKMRRDKPVFNNPGSAKTGLRLDLTFHGLAKSWGIQTPTGSEILRVTNGASNLFANNDRLVVDTNFGRRTITRVRLVNGSPVYLNLLPFLQMGPVWHQLRPGANSLVITAGNEYGNWTWNSITITPRKWGI